MAVVLVAVVTLVRLYVVSPTAPRVLFLMYSPAVMLAALYGGLGAGLLAAGLSGATALLLWGNPPGLHHLSERESTSLIMFLINAGFMSAIIEGLHRARQRLLDHQEELETKVEERTAELARTNEQLNVEILERTRAAARMTKALRELQDVKAVLDSHAILAEVDKTGIILRVNDNFCAVSKYPRAELEGEDFRTLAWEPSTEEFDNEVWDTLKAGRVWKGDLKVRAKDGGFFWVDTTLLPFLDKEGRPTRFVAIWEDISERKRAEQAVAESEARYRAIGESLDYGVWICDAEGRNTYASDSFLHLVGMTQEECSNFGWGEVLHPQDREETLKAWKDCVRTGGVWDREMRFRGVDEQWHYALSRGVTVRDDEGHLLGWAGINLDIAEFKRAQDEILKLNAGLELRVAERTEELRQANEELKEQFAVRRRFEEEILTVTKREQQRIGQDLHDDLGQQLAGVWCLTRVLEKSLSTRQAPEAVQAARVSELLEKSLVTTHSLARGLLPVTPEPHGLMSALITLANRVSEVFDIKCHLECAEPVEVEDAARATHLYRIAQESVSNAVKHGGAKHVTIELAADEDSVILTVWNDGAPLPASQGFSESMGLRIMRYRAAILEGTLQIQNHEGGGVAVTCTMPQKETTAPNARLSHVSIPVSLS